MVTAERGAGSVLVIGLVGAVLALASAFIAVGSGFDAAQRAANAAEQSALAGADAASGRFSGAPCEAARRTSERNRATLRACTVSGLVVTVEVVLPALGIDIVREARAGPPT